MSSLQTDSQVIPARKLVLVQREITQTQPQPQTRSFAASIKGAWMRFVRWIDKVDADGQQYWSR